MDFNFSVDKYVFTSQLCTGLFFDSSGTDGLGAPAFHAGQERGAWRCLAGCSSGAQQGGAAPVACSSSYKICSVGAGPDERGALGRTKPAGLGQGRLKPGRSFAAGILEGPSRVGPGTSIGDFS